MTHNTYTSTPAALWSGLPYPSAHPIPSSISIATIHCFIFESPSPHTSQWGFLPSAMTPRPILAGDETGRVGAAGGPPVGRRASEGEKKGMHAGRGGDGRGEGGGRQETGSEGRAGRAASRRVAARPGPDGV